MKSPLKYLWVVIAVYLAIMPSCREIAEDIIDCSIESAFLSVHSEADAADQKLIHFEFRNNSSGDFILDPSIHWDFGDGQTITTTDLKPDHTYVDSGTYHVVASYTLRRGTASCTGTKEHDVDVQLQGQ